MKDAKVLDATFEPSKSENVFVSWSGGKDSSLACYRAMSGGLNVRYLASMITKNTGRLFPHYLSPEILRMQAKAIGIPMMEQWIEIPDHVKRETKIADYDVSYRKMLINLKEQGITGGVFGVVSMGNRFADAHWDWVEGVCRPIGIKPYLPLWNQTRESIIRDVVNLGFEPVIIVADNHRLGKEWLGRKLNKDLLDELKKRHQQSPDGKVGLYHTFVIDGPIFKKRLEILEADKVMIDGIWYLDILKCRLESKVPERWPMPEPLVACPT